MVEEQSMLLILYRENFAPVLFSPSALRAKLTLGLIKLYMKHYVRKLDSKGIQDWAKQSQVSIGRK